MELEDQSWFPMWMRQYQVDFLGALSSISNLYGPVIPYLQAFEPKTVVDLASGNGQTALSVLTKLNLSEVKITDKYPPKSTMHVFELDLLHQEYPKADLYTMFNGLHHFDELEIQHILNSIDKEKKFFFVEPLGPRIGSFIKVFISTLILPFFIIPFVLPFRWDRLIMTYIIPIGPLICFYDGIISVFKSYSLKTLKDFCERANGRSIKAGKIKGRFTTFNYISS